MGDEFFFNYDRIRYGKKSGECMENMNREQLENYREKLLEAYHAKKEDLEFAEDDMEEAWIEEELEKYRKEIKACLARIRELEEEKAKDV